MAAPPTEIKVATFNVSMESSNYLPRGETGNNKVLAGILAKGDNPQVKNIAAIIQRVRPDVILLNEFDYIANPEEGVQLFIKNYLNQAQQGSAAIDYPYFYYSTVNTGQPSPFDLDNDGKASGVGADAWGYGFYPGQYGMVILSKFPIDTANVRTFQHFKWRDMPGFMPTTKQDGSPWYSPEAWQQMPLSSKSHWDIPLTIDDKTVHILASHPTPPVFDGPENRNGIRNHDEIRFWLDYLNPAKADYIYDDNGKTGGLAANNRFVLLGDLNASADGDGDAINTAIKALVNHDKIKQNFTPASLGAAENTPELDHAKYHTAGWRMRADYVLASDFGWEIKDGGVFWPAKNQPDYPLVGTRGASSDHRLVWLTLELSAD
ncbi:endonuclease/exonuclease/phosphatase family protein [Arsukibacterium indicum]|uniref:Endonuclease/exonuclease/phosphatase family protein n=1 Tax=Arsukibacterium indicum TaxID=2848612 RepID=A0ABS6MMR1_9GAMM|nr:endonuclease/exonuclease/phosphatase family protein [Arsukibacterium indicum]MBV2129664.1 endonuclease/exonuclease/phosphatase family protein [Arsukibacterium indicum]